MHYQKLTYPKTFSPLKVRASNFTSSNATQGTHQVFSVEPGETYTFEIDLHRPSGMNKEINVVIWKNTGPSGAFSVHTLTVNGTNTFSYNATSSEIFVQIRQAGTYYLDNIRMYRVVEETVVVEGVKRGLGYRYGFGSHEKDDEVKGSGNWYTFGDYGYDPRIVQRPSPDPLAAKHPYESPYVVFGGNPIIYIDPDGREKIIALDKNNEKDQTIIAGAEKYTDDGAIHIFGHGSSRGMSLVVDGKKYTIRTAKQLDAFLSKHSETWQNKKEGDKPVIVLHSCRTGQNKVDGSSSFAQEVSDSETFKDATIIAPDQRVYFSESGEIGAYKAKYADKQGEYKRDEDGEIKSKARSSTPGSWKVFKGGKQTGQYSGDWKPKEKPTLLDDFTKKEEVK